VSSYAKPASNLPKKGSWKASNRGQREIQDAALDPEWFANILTQHCPQNIQGWEFYGIHSGSFQVFKYSRHDTFPDHEDKPIEISNGLQSIFTVVVYLNECKGGETGFPQRNLTYSPKIGHSIIFPQNLIYNSSMLESEVKYILRAQVMCWKVDGSDY
jgi:prolyl 4-hydroxylase